MLLSPAEIKPSRLPPPPRSHPPVGVALGGSRQFFLDPNARNCSSALLAPALVFVFNFIEGLDVRFSEFLCVLLPVMVFVLHLL